MKRATPPKRTSSKEQYRNKILPLAHLINSLLTTPSTELHAHEASPHRPAHNASRMEVAKGDNNYSSPRPQSSRNGQGRGCEDIVVTISPERRGNRPKSSTLGAQYRATFTCEGNPRELNIENFRQAKCESARNYSSVSQKQELRVEYRLADNPFSKAPNKPPKSIQSSKSIGAVRGYGVNSHKYHASSEVCEGRILIIANLTKTTKLEAITSLYAIFESSKSVLFLDFVREQFQAEVSKKLDAFPPPAITKELIESCLHRVENKFCELYNVAMKKNAALTYSITNSYGLSYSMVFVRQDEVTICTKGASHAKSSMSFGSKMQGQHSHSLHLRRLSRDEVGLLDFVVLISKFGNN